MKVTTKTDLLKENAELRARLEEVEETLRAISAGEVDALVMKDRVYTLHGAETPYRILVEAMNEIALTLAPDGTISYCNGRLSELLRVPHETIIGTPLRRFVTPPDHPKFDKMFAESQKCSSKGEVGLEHNYGMPIPVHLSLSAMTADGNPGIGAVITNLSESKRVEIALKMLTEDLEARIASSTMELLARNEQLTRSNNAMAGHELEMIKLKNEINTLCAKLGQPVRYPVEGRQKRP